MPPGSGGEQTGYTMRFEILSPHHPDRPLAEDCIRSVYRHHFDARPVSLASRLAVLFGPDGDVLCAAGMRHTPEPLLSEQYLDAPVERAASVLLGHAVRRGDIVEISTLAAAHRCSVGFFLSAFVNETRALGATTLLFTATGRLRAYLCRNGVAVVEVTAARPERVPNTKAWGTYYDHDPVVCLAPDTLARPFAEAPAASLTGARALEAA